MITEGLQKIQFRLPLHKNQETLFTDPVFLSDIKLCCCVQRYFKFSPVQKHTTQEEAVIYPGLSRLGKLIVFLVGGQTAKMTLGTD